MTWYVAVLLSALVGMSYLLVKVRWQMRKLEEQLRFVQDKQSDGILVSDIRILGIGKLTDSLNEILQKQRSNRQEWVQKEKRLVQTYTNLSHDIRTPLTSLDGYFHLFEDTENAKELFANYSRTHSCVAGYVRRVVYLHKIGKQKL